mmetsp:Transcript_67643/g.187599  ORF Transcript_67643/g.187599 Transcript_67643/m.187599 type:complete len:390 (+) Transcript_67643:95-1264(+)
MAEFEETIRKLRAVAISSATQITHRELGPDAKSATRTRPQAAAAAAATGAPLPPPPPPPVKRPRHAQVATGATATGAADTEPRSFSVIKVPEALVGMLIGKGGQGLKPIEAESGVKVTVGKLSDAGYRRVCLEGSPDGQAKAQALIEHFVAQREAQDAAKHVLSEQVTTAELIQVPERFVGIMIGKGGETIKRVKDSYNIFADFEKESTSGSETRVLTLRGSAQNTAAAREQVERLLLDCHRRHGIFNKALEDKYGQSTARLQPLLPQGDGTLEANAFSMRGLPEAFAPLGLPATANPMPDPAGGATAAPAQEGVDPTVVVAPQQGCPASGPLPWVADVPDAEALWAMRYEEVLPWAIYYANNPTCVAYYLQLRAAAAEAVSSATLGAA